MKIKVTGGYVGEVTLEVRDRKGADLSAAGIKMMLLAVGGALPERVSAAWVNPSSAEYEAAGVQGDSYSRARVTLLVNSGTPVGRYKAWVLAALSPTSVPLCAEDEIIEVW